MICGSGIAFHVVARRLSQPQNHDIVAAVALWTTCSCNEGVRLVLLTDGNFPDRVWTRLKAWAELQARDGGCPSLERCEAQVQEIATELTGRLNALPDEVVTFYAAETAQMVEAIGTLLRAACDAEPENATGG